MNDPAPIDFRAAIRQAMAAQAMTQTELAKASGVSQAKISSYLAGKADLKGANIERLLAQLDLRIES